MWSDYGKRFKNKKNRAVKTDKSDSAWGSLPKRQIDGSALSKRVQGQLQPDQKNFGLGSTPMAKPIDIRIVLGDFGKVGMIAFCQDRIQLGQIVRITILDPVPFYFKARIAWNFELLASSPVISIHAKYTFRIGLDFVFENKEEQNRILEYRDLLLSGNFNLKAA